MRGRLKEAASAFGFLALLYGGLSHARQAREDAALPTALEPESVAPTPPADEWRALPALDPRLLARQAAEYDAQRPKSVLLLQKFRQTSSLRIRGPGGREGTATLVDLNPRINSWYLLELRRSDGETIRLHLENAHPDHQRLVLDPVFPSGLVIASASMTLPCDLWSDCFPRRLWDAALARSPYVELCDGEVLVRHRTRGSRTDREWAADFLRSKIWGGETLTVLVRRTVYADAFLEKADLVSEAPATPLPPDEAGYPRPALVSPASRDHRISSRDLGIAAPDDGILTVGRWVPVTDIPGVFASMLTPGMVAPEVFENDRVRDLDAVERNALVYLVAFDLGQLDLGFALGTDHPGVGWSSRVRRSVQDTSLPGPDGIESLEPLEPTGLVSPQIADRVVATFAGGFKRLHGAFRSGALAQVNFGSHYGFVEEGTVLSKLQPGLATLLSFDDGEVEMKTWSRADDARLERVRFARQNGVPLVERDPRTGKTGPGSLVGRWAEGNWSGTQDSKLRTVRAGAALQEAGGRRFLLYGYFSSATPSAMALVFGAYGCTYAMHLDMNALEHTYLALYGHANAGQLEIQHLVRGMGVLDKTSGATTVPRFLGYADNRDFLYLSRKVAPPSVGTAQPPAPAP